MKKKTFLLSIQFILLSIFAQAQSTSHASIRLFNPTSAATASIVEIPAGALATPGLINWNNVHLEANGTPIPFSFREGKVHWKADLKGAIKNPLPEDILVFSTSVAPAASSTVKIVDGSLKSMSVMTRRNGNITVAYPDFSVFIDERTGMLNNIVALKDSLLNEPMRIQFFEVEQGVIEQHGSMNPGNMLPSLTLKKGKNVATSSVKLVSSFSTPALTELNFVIAHQGGISIGLTYRVYPSGQLEIISDERPWTMTSPWLKYGLTTKFTLSGEKKELDAFQTYFPYYGFKDYAASVKSIGERYEGDRSITYVFGEESLNGRFWKRKLAVVPLNAASDEAGIINLLSEGLVAIPQPISSEMPAEVQVIHDTALSDVAQIFINGISRSGIKASAHGPANNKSFIISLGLGEKSNVKLTGDGFSIRPSANGIEIIALTKYGLYKAVSTFVKYSAGSKSAVAPLVSSNPVIDLRAGGFGGGAFEVDFPYGNEAEWKKAIDGMMMSGMNSMTDLGMWSNWKMPVSFKYMPELMSTDSNAYDEVSGARFSAFDSSREFAIKLIDYVHARGGKVWLWVPVGAIPTTFAEKFPDATVAGKSIAGKTKVPRFMHPEYRRYLESYFKELLETYPLDGFVLIRDDNGGIDDTEEFKQYLEGTKTKDRVWEQYVVLHKLIRDLNFDGTIAVYPYFDLYKPAIEELIPKDLVIVGHGSGIGTLTRHYETLGTMGDTWLDNLFVGFRVPSTERMKRLLSDRGSYWIGGAYTAMELSWEAIGYFGWQPTASVNSFRYEFGSRTFGDDGALEFVSFSDASDNLWEIMNGPLFPPRWFSVPKKTQDSVSEQAEQWLVKYKRHLGGLEEKAKGKNLKGWFKQAALYAVYFNYHLERASLSSKLKDLVLSHSKYQAMESNLPGYVRQEIVAINQKIYDLADKYDKQMAETPGDMLAATRTANLTKPFREFVYGYSGYGTTVDQLLTIKQFDAVMKCTVASLRQGAPFEIHINLKNTGFMPWMKEHGFEIKVRRQADKFSLKSATDFVTRPLVFGDTVSVVLRGVAPKDHGWEQVELALVTPFLNGRQAIVEHSVLLKW